MNSKELYTNLCQIIVPEGGRVTWPTDFHREAIVHVARNNKNSAISHITVEFHGIRAKFLCCLLFDGTGDSGVSVHGFAMPRIKLSVPQRALAAMSVLQFLVDGGWLKADFNFIRERICSDVNGGTGSTSAEYDIISAHSVHYVNVEDQPNSAA